MHRMAQDSMRQGQLRGLCMAVWHKPWLHNAIDDVDSSKLGKNAVKML
jgi:hypothetical protein